jgi:hypothetical protein
MRRSMLAVVVLTVWLALATPGSRALAAPAAISSWYFAEGSTQPGFATFLLLANPNAFPVNANVTYYKENGSFIFKSYFVGAHRRFNIFVNAEVPNAALAMKVESDNLLFAERSQYTGSDGHASHGVSAPANVWYFAEGTTSPPDTMWLLIGNFNVAPAHVTLTFMKEDGSQLVRSVTVGPTSRKNVFVNDYFPPPGVAVSTKVESDLPIVAERSLYWGGSHNAPGVTAPATTWYLAEGFTGGDSQTWILLMNPGALTANATLKFFKEDGTTLTQPQALAPHSRTSIFVNGLLPGVAFGTKITSDQPIVAERAEYFGPPGARGGHDSEGATTLGTHWTLAEGSTQGGFSTFILVLNPNAAVAHLVAKYLREDGSQVLQTYSVAPTSRATILVNALMPGVAFATDITSDQPIVVERAMYFNGGEGGTDSLGFLQ